MIAFFEIDFLILIFRLLFICWRIQEIVSNYFAYPCFDSAYVILSFHKWSLEKKNKICFIILKQNCLFLKLNHTSKVNKNFSWERILDKWNAMRFVSVLSSFPFQNCHVVDSICWVNCFLRTQLALVPCAIYWSLYYTIKKENSMPPLM